MASVKLKPGESQEQLLRRFRKRVTNAGILSTVRRKRWHISKSESRRKRQFVVLVAVNARRVVVDFPLFETKL